MSSEHSYLRVGALVVAALLIAGVGIFLIGDENSLFSSKQRYYVQLVDVGGLQAGNPVQLNGVNVGRVKQIILPEDPGQDHLVVEISVERRFAKRLRRDSRARIKTLGLLGDKYIELTSGSAQQPAVPDGGEIEAAEATDVDRLIASGEDVVANIVAISHSLTGILQRIERGEGILGQLMTGLENDDRSVRDSIFSTLDGLAEVSDAISTGKGPLTRLFSDEQLADRFEGAFTRFETLMVSLEEGSGVVPHLLHGEQLRADLDATVLHLRVASERLDSVTLELEQGSGLVPRLISDRELAEKITNDLETLLSQLTEITGRIADGEGTLGKLIEDPQLYDAVNDVIVGVDESKLLRWLVRNRQKAGIEKRYQAEKEGQKNVGDSQASPVDPSQQPR